MNAFEITTAIPNTHKEGFYKLIFECQLTMDELREALVRDGVVLGKRIQVKRLADRSYVVRGRSEYMLSRGGFLAIEPTKIRVDAVRGDNGAFFAERIDAS